MSALILRRLLWLLPTLLVLLLLVFLLLHAAPGGPFDEDRALAPELQARIAAAYHLDEPLWRQGLRWAGGVLRGDLGPSFRYPDLGVNQLLAAGLPVSMLLGASAMFLAVLAGTALGTLAATRRGSWLDQGVQLVSLAGLSVPAFVVGPLLVLVFAVSLGWLPAGGWDGWRSALLPVLALALPQVGAIARLVRGALLEVLSQDFVRTARAKGLPEAQVLWRHALPPALLPLVSWLGPASAQILTGSIVVEQVFSLPGVGRYFVQGALNRDYTLVMGVVLVYGVLVVLLNLLSDLAYGVLDPRARSR